MLLRNARLYYSGEFIESSILVEDGVIKAIVKDEEKHIGRVDKVYDARGLPVIPGGIDIHAHIYDPDYTHHEDWYHGSIAAAYGGITTFYDMPLRLFVDSVEKLKMKIEAGLRESVIDFGVHAGMITDDNMDCIKRLSKEGVVGYKFFTLKPWGISDHGLLKAFRLVRDVGGVAIVHAEDDALIDYGLERYRGSGDPLAHHLARSDYAEAVAVYKVGWYSRVIGNKLHIAHVTSRLEVETIAFLKRHGVRLTCETCPHYLYFTRDDVGKWGNYLKCAPSIKTSVDREALWEGLASGVIDVLASDHAPSTREEKEVDVWSAWGGLPVLETMLPLLYTLGVKTGRIGFGRMIEVLSTNPARVAGLYPRKGRLWIGSYADIVVLDVNHCIKVSSDKLHYKVGWTPFEGLELCGWPLHVFVRGEPVIIDRELVGEKGTGRYVASL